MIKVVLNIIWLITLTQAQDISQYLKTELTFENAKYNTDVINSYINNNSLVSIDYNVYPMIGGIQISNVSNFTLNINGILNFSVVKKEDYPANTNMIQITNSNNITFVSSNQSGKILGGGEQWYGYINLFITKDKPILLYGENSNYITISYLDIEMPPYWTIYLKANYVTIHNIKINAVSGDIYRQPLLEILHSIRSFNTDGIDVEGDHVHIYDCEIHVGDDCVAVKGGSHWLVENIIASGLGMSIGYHGQANNITFRNVYMNNTVRAIYIKTNATNVLYQNFNVSNALLFPIWIGPSYQFLNGDCPLTWPFISADVLPEHAFCNPSTTSTSKNVTLMDINIRKTYTTPIIIIGNANQQDVYLKGVNFVETPNYTFPYSNESKYYNTSINGKMCTTDICLKEGVRDPIQPCCDNTVYTGGKWGYCE